MRVPGLVSSQIHGLLDSNRQKRKTGNDNHDKENRGNESNHPGIPCRSVLVGLCFRNPRGKEGEHGQSNDVSESQKHGTSQDEANGFPEGGFGLLFTGKRQEPATAFEGGPCCRNVATGDWQEELEQG